jgi:hypothetical protein
MILLNFILKCDSIEILYSNMFLLKYVELVNGSIIVIIPAEGGCSIENQRSRANCILDVVGRPGDVSVQFGNDDADDGVQSGDDDVDDLENEGPGIGHGGWVDGEWHDPIDPHPIAPRERCSRSEFDLDYISNPIQVMTSRN